LHREAFESLGTSTAQCEVFSSGQHALVGFEPRRRATGAEVASDVWRASCVDELE
jgi:hypothetical protein